MICWDEAPGKVRGSDTTHPQTALRKREKRRKKYCRHNKEETAPAMLPDSRQGKAAHFNKRPAVASWLLASRISRFRVWPPQRNDKLHAPAPPLRRDSPRLAQASGESSRPAARRTQAAKSGRQFSPPPGERDSHPSTWPSADWHVIVKQIPS